MSNKTELEREIAELVKHVNEKDLKISNLLEEIEKIKPPPEKSRQCLSIVYPYVHEADGSAVFAQWEELRYSLRSIEENFQGDVKIFVIGDDPGWFSEEINFIHCPRISDNPPRDIVNKLNTVIAHEDISDDFIWMNDDIYMINKVNLCDIQILKSTGNLSKVKIREDTAFRRNLKLTYNELLEHNLSTWNYSTHLPLYYNKEKLTELFRTFDFDKNSFLISTLYHNYFFNNQRPTVLDIKEDNIKVGNYRRAFDYEKMLRFFKFKKFFNHSQTGFSNQVVKILTERFPNKSIYESDE